jgi:hypothetical protein
MCKTVAAVGKFGTGGTYLDAGPASLSARPTLGSKPQSVYVKYLLIAGHTNINMIPYWTANRSIDDSDWRIRYFAATAATPRQFA